jgi:hypothetical protein
MKGPHWIPILFTGLLIGMAGGQDWLEGGYVGRSYDSDIAQYFSEPIFYPNPSSIQPNGWQAYYPYSGGEFFRDYAQPYQFRPGIYPGPYGVYPYNPEPYYSDFRLRSLMGLQWEPFQKNWSKTVDFAKTSSSMRVFQNGVWVTP